MFVQAKPTYVSFQISKNMIFVTHIVFHNAKNIGGHLKELTPPPPGPNVTCYVPALCMVL